MDKEPRWIDVEQAAQLLGLSKPTVYQYVAERRIPFVKIPGSTLIRFDQDELNDWMRKGQHNEDRRPGQ